MAASSALLANVATPAIPGAACELGAAGGGGDDGETAAAAAACSFFCVNNAWFTIAVAASVAAGRDGRACG